MLVGEVMGSANRRRERDGKDGRELLGRRRRGGGFALSYRAGNPGLVFGLDLDLSFLFLFLKPAGTYFSFYSLLFPFLQCPVSEKLLHHFSRLSPIICIYIFPSAPLGACEGEDETRRRYGTFFIIIIGDHWRRLCFGF